jgi:hypothetical protein
MRTFEQHIFIDCQKDIVYDHIAEPINMIGLWPSLTTIDVMQEQMDENGITLRPFYTMEVLRWAGIPWIRSRIYSVIHLIRPQDELEFHVHSKLNIKIVFKYKFVQYNDLRTHITQTIEFEPVNKLLEGFVFDQAVKAQRVLFTNLKARLEKQKPLAPPS